MNKQSVLGLTAERVKTDIRLPRPLSKNIEQACGILGIRKNAFFAMAAGRLLIDLCPLLQGGRKRKAILKQVLELFQKIIKSASESL